MQTISWAELKQEYGFKPLYFVIDLKIQFVILIELKPHALLSS